MYSLDTLDLQLYFLPAYKSFLNPANSPGYVVSLLVSENPKRILFSILMVAIGKFVQIASSPAHKKNPSLASSS